MRCVLPNGGTRISAARNAVCNRIEIAKERRRTPFSRRRCSGSPSTKQPRKKPSPLSGIASETFWGSRDITHLHKNAASDDRYTVVFSIDRSAVTQNGIAEILRRRFPGGCSRSPGDRRRARRDV